MKKIAILGATGHIGKSLTEYCSRKKEFEVFLFSRTVGTITDFLNTLNLGDSLKFFHACDYEQFSNETYDAIVNCTGIGNPAVYKKDPSQIFYITEHFDSLVISYLQNHPKTHYISLSSGAVYGQGEVGGMVETSSLNIGVNTVKPADYYAVAKLNSEAKHRAFSQFNITDIRVFSFFSRFMSLDSGFLLALIIEAVKAKTIFKTNPDNIVRDYAHVSDLYNLISLIIEKEKINDVFDLYGLAPVAKFEVLEHFKEAYGLQYEVDQNHSVVSATGNKTDYFSKFHKAEVLGFKPAFSSIEVIKEELGHMNL